MTKLYNAFTTADVRTENGALAHSTTGSFCLDLFNHIGNYSEATPAIQVLMAKAFAENADMAVRILLWARDIRGGAGRRTVFRSLILTTLSQVSDYEAEVLIRKIPELGRWDDLLIFMDTKYEDFVSNFILNTGLKDTNTSGLCAKWMPRKGPVANKLRKMWKMSPKTYRKTLVEKTKVVETLMCDNRWDRIEFKTVPSRAMLQYRNAFYNHDGERFSEFLEDVKKGKTKINAQALYPHDLIDVPFYPTSYNPAKVKSVEQWNALPNFLEGNDESILPLVDVSGSMNTPIAGKTQAIDVAIALGLYISERTEGLFKDHIMTFSSNPKLEKLNGDINQRLQQLHCADWGMSTDLEKAYVRILEAAVEHNIPEKEMPGTLLVLSDMQFNTATRHFPVTHLQNIKKMYATYGYKMPHIVFWNLCARNVPQHQAKQHTPGATLVSGFSPSLLKTILTGEEFDPMDTLRETVMVGKYAWRR